MEADVDMDSSGVANHVVAMVKGVTTSQTIDMAVVLQVTHEPPAPCPLQCLLCAAFVVLDCLHKRIIAEPSPHFCHTGGY